MRYDPYLQKVPQGGFDSIDSAVEVCRKVKIQSKNHPDRRRTHLYLKPDPKKDRVN